MVQDVSELNEKLYAEKEKRQVKDFADALYRGAHEITKKVFRSQGSPAIHYVHIQNSPKQILRHVPTYIDESLLKGRKVLVKPGDLILSATAEEINNVVKALAYEGSEELIAGHSVLVLKHGLNSKYLAYAFMSEAVKEQKQFIFDQPTTLYHLGIDRLRTLFVPIADLEDQQAIVDILDAKLAECLQAKEELADAEEHFEQVRNDLMTKAGVLDNLPLTIDLDTARKQLAEEGYTVLPLDLAATRLRTPAIRNEITAEGPYPLIRNGRKPAAYIDEWNHDGPCVVISVLGASVGYTSYWDEPVFIADAMAFEAEEEFIRPKYLYHTLKMLEANMADMAVGVKIMRLSTKAASRIRIVIPPLAKQDEILQVLEGLEKEIYCKETGIPAKIARLEEEFTELLNRLIW